MTLDLLRLPLPLMDNNMMKEQSVKSSSDSIDDHLTAEKDALVLQLEAANAKIETITAEKEKYRLDAEKYKAMNNNKENGDGDTIAQLQLEIEGLKQKLVLTMSQITTLSDQKSSLITKMASILEPDLAKLSNKQDSALDDEARSNQEASVSSLEVLGSMMTKLTMSDVKLTPLMSYSGILCMLEDVIILANYSLM